VPAAGKYKIVPGGAVLTTPSNYILNYISGNLVVGKAILKAYARDTTRVYGTANPVFSIRYSGFINGDSPSSIIPPVAATSATATSNVGTYPIVLTGGTSVNYKIVDSNGTMTIIKAGLTATADNKTKVYGDPNPVLTITYSGFMNGDGPSKITSPVLSVTAVNLSPVGNYPIVLTGGNAVNYTIQKIAGVLNITPAVLNVKADDKGIDDDEDLPVFTSTITGFGGRNLHDYFRPYYTVSPIYTKNIPEYIRLLRMV
jgi:hypothetical protein